MWIKHPQENALLYLWLFIYKEFVSWNNESASRWLLLSVCALTLCLGSWLMVGNEGFEHLTRDHIIFDLEIKFMVNNFRMTVDCIIEAGASLYAHLSYWNRVMHSWRYYMVFKHSGAFLEMYSCSWIEWCIYEVIIEMGFIMNGSTSWCSFGIKMAVGMMICHRTR